MHTVLSVALLAAALLFAPALAGTTVEAATKDTPAQVQKDTLTTKQDKEDLKKIEEQKKIEAKKAEEKKKEEAKKAEEKKKAEAKKAEEEKKKAEEAKKAARK